MSWHSITEGIMHTCTQVMGELVQITLNDGLTYEVECIYEERTNFDETDSQANIENFNAVADFKSQDLPMAPRRNNIVRIPRTNKQYKVTYVEDDGWARHRCYMKDFV